MESISPVASSDDEVSRQERMKKRLKYLKKAREAKRKKSTSKVFCYFVHTNVFKSGEIRQ